MHIICPNFIHGEQTICFEHIIKLMIEITCIRGMELICDCCNLCQARDGRKFTPHLMCFALV
jgi:hypothetical protein